MNPLHLAAVCVIGFVGCAEFGSWALVHPVLRRLPVQYWLEVEQGLLRTFGRVMPIGMTAAPILAGSTAITLDASTLAWLATGALVVALVTTIAVNLKINITTGHWDPHDPPEDWRQQRRRWETFQGIRASLQLFGFVAISAAALAA